MKDSQLHAHVVVKTSNLVISRRRYAEDLKNICSNPCGTCSTIIYDLLTNDIIVLWRGCCCRRRRRFLSSLMKVACQRVWEELRRNPIEDGAISGFSGQKSVPE